MRQLAEDLTFCEVDVWLDEWELQIGDSLRDAIGQAIESSKFVGIALGDNFGDSGWARDELKQALSREKRLNKISVLPLLCGNCTIPPFLEDKIQIDFVKNYYEGVARLACMIHGITRLRTEEGIRKNDPDNIAGVIATLRYCGVEPYIILGQDDFEEIVAAGVGSSVNGRVRFNPEKVRRSDVSPRIKDLMARLIDDVWAEPKQRDWLGRLHWTRRQHNVSEEMERADYDGRR